jgi:hypothetical protein
MYSVRPASTTWQSLNFSIAILRAVNAPQAALRPGRPAAWQPLIELYLIYAGLNLHCFDRNARYILNANRATHDLQPFHLVFFVSYRLAYAVHQVKTAD